MAKTTSVIGDITVRSCRACLDSTPAEYVHLDSEDWLDLYKFCVDAKIGQTPLLDLLCAECCRVLRQFSKFKLKCQQSELFWQTLFNKDSKCHVNQPHNDIKIKEEDEDGAFDNYEYDDILDPDVHYSNVIPDSDHHNQSVNNIEVEVKIGPKPKNMSLKLHRSLNKFTNKFSEQDSTQGYVQSIKLATSDLNKANSTESQDRKSRGSEKKFKGRNSKETQKYEEEIDVVSVESPPHVPSALDRLIQNTIQDSHTNISSEEEIDVVSFGDKFAQPALSSWRVPSSLDRHLQKSIQESAMSLRPAVARRKLTAPAPAPAGVTSPRKRLRRSGHCGRRGRRPLPASDSDSDAPEIVCRAVRNDMERMRRISLKNLFDELKNQVPATRVKERASKIFILRKAVTLCRQLQEEDLEKDCLERQQNKLLTKLKKLRSQMASRYRPY